VHAVAQALPERRRVSALAKVSRRRVEQRWSTRDDP